MNGNKQTNQIKQTKICKRKNDSSQGEKKKACLEKSKLQRQAGRGKPTQDVLWQLETSLPGDCKSSLILNVAASRL